LSSAQAGVAGNSDIINLSGANALTQSGASDTFVFQPKIGEDTIYGFAASDSVQFSATDFANWPALQTHISQSGANTLIEADSSDIVTLAGVAATSLTASQFHFV
jgi:Ca2+-binding RTX toxin-like protein